MVDRKRHANPGALTATALALYPLAGYQVDLGPVALTLDRLLLFLATLSLFYALLWRKVLVVSAPLLLTVFYVFHITIVSFLFVSELGSDWSSQLINAIFVAVFYLMAFLWVKSPVTPERWIFYVNTIIALTLISFSLYSMHIFLGTGSPATELPFADSIPFVTASSSHRVESGGYVYGNLFRFAMPFSRPQDYGTVSAITAGLIWWCRQNGSIGTIPAVVLVSTLLTSSVLSGSRSTLFPILGALAVGLVMQGLLTRAPGRAGLRVPLLAILYAFAAVSLGLIIDFSVGAFYGAFDRYMLAAPGGHLAVRASAYNEFMQANMISAFVGHGVKAFEYKVGYGSHMSYTTVLYDYGMVGLCVFFGFFIYAWKLWLAVRRRIDAGEASILAGMLVLLMLCHVGYQFQTSIGPWVGLGVVTGILFRHRRDMKYLARL